MDVYVEGSLPTTAGIDHIDRGGTLRVGVEDRLRVARNVRSDEDRLASRRLCGGHPHRDDRAGLGLVSRAP